MKSQHEVNPIEGSWDLTIDHDGNFAASWLEIKPWGYTKVGRFLHTGGYPRPLSVINFENNQFDFTVPWESENRFLKVEGEFINDKLKGTIYYPDGKHKRSWKIHCATDLSSGKTFSMPPHAELLRGYVYKLYPDYQVSKA